MLILARSRCTLNLSLAVGLLAGCGGSQSAIGTPRATPQAQMNRQGALGTARSQSSPSVEAPAVNSNLYVANSGNNTVTVYSNRGVKLRAISSGIFRPNSLAFGSAGYLYVANTDSDVAEYAPGKTSLLRKITQGIAEPDALALDGSDNLFVSNYYSPFGDGTITKSMLGGKRTVTDDPFWRPRISRASVRRLRQSLCRELYEHGRLRPGYHRYGLCSGKGSVWHTISDGVYDPTGSWL